MAIAGGATTAYKCVLTGKLLHRAPVGMIQRSQCVEPDEAIKRLRGGEGVIIAGSDIHLVRTRLSEDAE